VRIYLAARYSRRQELSEYATQLRDLGHIVTSTWIDGHHEASSPHGPRAEQLADGAERRGWALEDWADLARSDALICFTEQAGPTVLYARVSGGRHVELGIALAWELDVMIVGPRENLYHWLPEVMAYPTWDDALRSIACTGLRVQ